MSDINKPMKILTKTISFSLILSLLFSSSSFASEDEKIIYLTFDDGPGGSVTEDVLNILKDEDIKCTFFLIGTQITVQKDLVKRIQNEGHSIGLHSMSHDKCKLYSSNQDFLNEMLEEQKILEDTLGQKITILRFPFGCNNTTYHLKSSLVDLLHENNLKIYEWNVDSTDGGNHTASPSTFIKKAKSDKDNIILLMHCGFMNKNSAKALPEIIKYYKDSGYIFKPIDENTDELFHYIK